MLGFVLAVKINSTPYAGDWPVFACLVGNLEVKQVANWKRSNLFDFQSQHEQFLILMLLQKK